MTKINNEVMHLFYNRDVQAVRLYNCTVQHYFNAKFESDAYINIKLKEWRRYIKLITNTTSQNEYISCLEKYKVKLVILKLHKLNLLTNKENG